MSFRRMLTATLGAALASLLLAGSALAAGDPALGPSGGGPRFSPAFEKVAGATVYEYCDSVAGCYNPNTLELALFLKTKTWEFTHDPGVGGYFFKPVKQKFTYFVYDDGYCNGCYLVGLKTTEGIFDGGFYFSSGEFSGETWDAFKL
jgi:hypothetical protein